MDKPSVCRTEPRKTQIKVFLGPKIKIKKKEDQNTSLLDQDSERPLDEWQNPSQENLLEGGELIESEEGSDDQYSTLNATKTGNRTTVKKKKVKKKKKTKKKIKLNMTTAMAGGKDTQELSEINQDAQPSKVNPTD